MSSFGVIVGAFVAGCAVMWSSSAFLSLPHDHANAMPTPEQRRATPPVPVRPESTPLATPFARPTVTAEIRAHQAAIAAVRTARLAAGSTECDTPPSLLPSREYSVPLTDAFGQSLNLESVSRPWAKGAPASVSFGPRAAAELQREPSTLDFLQYYVHLGQPFIVRNYAQRVKLPALERWTDAYLSEQAGSTRLHVRRSHFGDKFFHYAHGWSDLMETTMPEFIASFNSSADDAQYYLGQGNLMGRRQPGTLQVLLPDVPVPPFTKALDLKHVNIWFGSGTIHNPAHYDANENILIMLSGTKTFTLFPPGARNFMYPVMRGEYSAPMTEPVDVSKVNLTQYPCFKHALAQATEVKLHAGDMLYVPPYWWHQVTSRGRSLAVNFWYSVHSLMLQQMMKAIDHSMLITDETGDFTQPPLRRQRPW